MGELWMTMISQREQFLVFPVQPVQRCSQRCITQSTELYHYRAYLETLLIYGSDAANSHLTNAY
jgi:hypothetical protein